MAPPVGPHTVRGHALTTHVQPEVPTGRPAPPLMVQNPPPKRTRSSCTHTTAYSLPPGFKHPFGEHMPSVGETDESSCPRRHQTTALSTTSPSCTSRMLSDCTKRDQWVRALRVCDTAAGDAARHCGKYQERTTGLLDQYGAQAVSNVACHFPWLRTGNLSSAGGQLRIRLHV